MKYLTISNIQSFRKYLRHNKEFRFNDIEHLDLHFLDEKTLIDIFQIFKFKNTKTLSIRECNMTNTKFLKYANVQALTDIRFTECIILSFADLKNYHFPNLKLLYINTPIKNIKFLADCSMPKLESLVVYSDCIKTVNPLLTSNFPKLLSIGLYLPKLKDIFPALLANFPKLNYLDYIDRQPIKFYDLSHKKYVKTKKYRIDILFASRVIKINDLLELVTSYIYKIYEQLFINKIKEKTKSLKHIIFTDI